MRMYNNRAILMRGDNLYSVLDISATSKFLSWCHSPDQWFCSQRLLCLWLFSFPLFPLLHPILVSFV